MAKKKKDLSERQKKILDVLGTYTQDKGYPPSIRDIGREANISSTSVVNYYLDQLEEMDLIIRDRKISRGVRLAKQFRRVIDELMPIPLVGPINATYGVELPGSDFDYYDSESSIDIARSLLSERDQKERLFALKVDGDSMIDALVNDGDIIIMKPAIEARNGEMVAVRMTDTDVTTLKYFYKENGHIRLQPANPTMEPTIVDDPKTVAVQGKVVLVIRQVSGSPI